MVSVVAGGLKARIDVRTLTKVLRAGSGTSARYSSTVFGVLPDLMAHSLSGNSVLSAESFGRASFGFGRLLFAVLRRGRSLERSEKSTRNTRNFVDCSKKGSLIRFRWFIEARDLAYKLQGSSANFFRSYRRVEVKERFDVSAHSFIPTGLVSDGVR